MKFYFMDKVRVKVPETTEEGKTASGIIIPGHKFSAEFYNGLIGWILNPARPEQPGDYEVTFPSCSAWPNPVHVFFRIDQLELVQRAHEQEFMTV